MALYLAIVGMLVVVCLTVGLAYPGTRRLERPGDRFLAAVWLGLVALSVLLLAVSLFAPLRPAVVLPTVILAVGSCAAAAPVRRALRDLRPGLTGPAFAAFLALAIAAALDAAQRGPTGDVGLYHYQAMRWNAEFGAVPGLALLHTRLGPASGWFSLHAAFDWGALQGRSEAIGGTLVLLLAGIQLSIAVPRILRRRATYADWFVLAALAFLSPFLVDRQMTSTYVETPLAVLAVMVGYLLLLRTSRAGPSGEEPGATRDVSVALLPALLAAGAVTWKLNAVPLLAVTFLWFAWRTRDRGRSVLLGGVGVVGLLAPMVGYNVVTSGCPLYPLPACLDVSWAVDASRNDYASLVGDWSRWRGPTPAEAGGLDWLGPWLRAKPLTAGLLLLTFTYGLVKGARATRSGRGGGAAWTAAVGAAGATFVMFAAPDERFLKIYLFLVPALLAGRLAQTIRTRLDGRGWLPAAGLAGHRGWATSTLPAVSIALTLLVFQPLLNLKSVVKGQPRMLVDTSNVEWWRPTAIHQPPVRRERVNNVDFLEPDPCCRCWAAPLPCTPYVTHQDIRLRAPERGLAGGFRRPPRPAGQATGPGARTVPGGRE